MTSPDLKLRVGPQDCPSPHGLANKLGRVTWAVVATTLFRWSPRLCHFWRRGLLKLFGAKVGLGVKIDPTVRIWAPWNLELGDRAAISYDVDLYSLDRIRIGHSATVSQYAFLCTGSHDVNDPRMGLTTKPIEIADQAWVCAGCFVGPGVTVQTGAVVAAFAVVSKDVPAWTIVGGNPAVHLKNRHLRDAQ